MQNHILTVIGMVIALLSLKSCAPYPPSHSLGTPGQPSAQKSLDPRLIGTWVCRDRHGTNILTLAPDGRGRLHTRKRGKFEHAGITWTTRSNILQLRKSNNWQFSSEGDPGYSTFNSGFVLRKRYSSYGRRNHKYDPQANFFRLSVALLEPKKFVASDLANPSGKFEFYKYSHKPVYDPYPAYAWFDYGGAKRIEEGL